ncbi:hypothetical protein AAEO50_18995, partial [Rossellomorea oryzaecorticis]
LCLAQNNSFVPGSKQLICAWLKTTHLCLAQNLPFVPGSKQSICAWHPKVPPLRPGGFHKKKPAVSIWTLPGYNILLND